MNVGEALLEVKNLGVAFGTGEGAIAALDNLSFTIHRGETFGLLGESGSGKSMTAMAIMRLLPAAARIKHGSILLHGNKDLLRLPEYAMRGIRGQRIAMIFQEPQTSLNPVLTVGHQIGESLRYHKGLRGSSQRDQSIALMASVGIPEPERRYAEYPHQFSGGMKQRIMIAIALAGEPDLLIADEPTTALDVTTQAQILALLCQIQKSTHMAILFITHDLAVAYKMADQVAIMRQGKIVEQNTRALFYAGPQHPYAQELLNALPNKANRDQAMPTEESCAGEPLLEIHDLKVHYPIRKGLLQRTVGFVRALDGVSLSVHRGQTVAVVGESGSGKTTFGKGILRLIRTTGGKVTFAGRVLSQLGREQLRQCRSELQIIFQDPYSSMNPRLMIADVIAEGMRAHGLGGTKKQQLQRVDELLEQVGLEPSHKNRYPHEFSGGQRQRICIARALAVEPKLIVCDEPTSSLDVSVQAQILTLLQNLQKSMGLTYLFITHNISVVEYLAHYVVVMYAGKIVEQGDVNQVLGDPQHAYTQQLLAATPKINSTRRH